MPLVRPLTTLSLRVCTWLMSMAGVPAGSRHAPLLGVLDDLQCVRVLEQRLRRNATPDEARAAERLLLLDHGYLHSQLRGADCGHVAARAGANHDDVISIRQRELLLGFVICDL